MHTTVENDVINISNYITPLKTHISYATSKIIRIYYSFYTDLNTENTKEQIQVSQTHYPTLLSHRLYLTVLPIPNSKIIAFFYHSRKGYGNYRIFDSPFKSSSTVVLLRLILELLVS